MKPRCVIVDGYGPSQFYFEKLVTRGFNVIHIQSAKTIPEHFSKMATDKAYIKHCIYEGDIKKLADELSDFAPISFLFSGFETGVQIADKLTKILGLSGNDPNFTDIRCDKYKTLSLLAEKKLISTLNYVCKCPESAIKWINENLKYPVVIKPTNSAGSQGVFVCHNEHEVRDNFKATVGQPNVLGHTTEEMIIQPLLQGKEYIINTVSCQGTHYVSDIWASSKQFIDGRFVYDNEVLLPSVGDVQNVLTDYINKVLNTLGIQNGPSHSEIILTNTGPVLLEVNPRLHGGILTSANDECLGHNQLDLTLDAYIDPKRFLTYAKKPYQLKKEMMMVIAINQREGLLVDWPELSDFKKIESYRFHRMRVSKGKEIKKTVDLASSPVFVYLVANNKDQLSKDYSSIQTLVTEGFKIENEYTPKFRI